MWIFNVSARQTEELHFVDVWSNEAHHKQSHFGFGDPPGFSERPSEELPDESSFCVF